MPKIERLPNVPTRHNNPLNVKYGAATRHWVESGQAELGDEATDGGRFLRFKTPETGFHAARELLSSPHYSGLTVDRAMRRWSGGGYGSEVAGLPSSTRMADLNPDQQQALVGAMAKREGFSAGVAAIDDSGAGTPPPGFVLDTPDSQPAPPEGFVLDSDSQETTLRLSMTASADTKPDHQAEILGLAKRTGIPADVVARNFDAIERRSKIVDTPYAQMLRDTPNLAAWVSEPEHMALAHDDLESLGGLETLLRFGANSGRALGAMIPATNAALWDALQAPADVLSEYLGKPLFGDRDPFADLSRQFAQYQREQETVATNVRGPQTGAGFGERAFYQGVESLGQNALLMGAAVGTGGAATPFVLGGMGVIAGGQAYGEAKRQGVPLVERLGFAGSQAAIEIATERIPVSELFKGLKDGAGLVKLLAKELASEIPGEQVATIFQDLNEWAVLPDNAAKPLGAYLAERPSAAAATLIATLVGTIGQVGITRAIDRHLLPSLGKAVTDSKTHERLPDKLREFLQHAAKDGIESVYLPVDEAKQYFQDKRVDPAEVLGPEGAARFQEAQATGADIEIPIADYATRIAAAEHGAFFNGIARIGDPLRMNAKETEALGQEEPTAELQTSENGPLQESSAKVREDITGQLLGQGLDRATVDAYVQTVEAAFRTMGERSGQDPFTLYQQYGLTVTRPIPEILRSLPNLDAHLDTVIDRLRSNQGPSQSEMYGKSLVEFLRAKGGVQDEGGDLTSREPDKGRKPFEKNLLQPESGMPLDTARELAAEAGYLDPQSSIADFLDKIDEELRGQPVYAPGQENPQVIEQGQVLDELGEYLQSRDINVRTATNAEIKRVLNQAAAESIDPLTGQIFEQQTSTGEARATIRFSPNRQVNIELLKNADLSSFLHESGHLFLEVFGDVVERLQKQSEPLNPLQQRMVEDYAKALKYLGVESRGQISTEQHETWARSVEAYLREGKTPSLELRSIFARFSAWLHEFYRSLTQLRVELTPEVRGVMDRLLATDEEITRAEEEAKVEGLLENAEIAKDLGISEKERRLYGEAIQKARDGARERLQGEFLSEYARYQQDWYRARRNEVRAEVTSEVHAQRGVIALAFLKDGAMPDGSPLPDGVEALKLDAKALDARYGKASRKPGQGATITNKLLSLDVYRREGGVSPEIAAEVLGYSSGNELIQALVDQRDPNSLIEAETDSRMTDQYGDMLTDGTAAEKARDAVMTEGRSEVLLAEMKALAKKQREMAPFVQSGRQKERQEQRTQQVTGIGTFERFVPTVEAVRAIAERRVREMRVRDLKPGTYWAAARRASKAATDAALKQNYAEALKQKQREVLAVEMYRAATEAKAEVEKARETFQKFFKPDADIAKTRNLDYVTAARAIASVLMFPGKQVRVDEALASIQAYDPGLYEVLSDQLAPALSAAEDYRELPYETFSALRDMALSLWAIAKREGQIEIDGKRVRRDDATSALTAQVAEYAAHFKDTGVTGLPTTYEKAERDLVGLKAWGRRVESWVSAMDGGSTGPFRTYLWNPVKDAINRFRSAKVVFLEKYQQLLKPIEQTLTLDPIAAPELNYTFGKDGSGGRAELLGALLHSGNRNDPKSNLAKLVAGRGWSAVRPDGTVDYSRFDRTIDNLIRNGTLTKKDFDFVQGIWDLFEEMKPGLQQAHKQAYGFYFREVPADALQTPWGPYRGGYVPAISDPRMNTAAAIRNDKQMTFESGTSWALPSAGLKSTISRVKVYEPLAMNLGFIPLHIDWALRFTHIQPAVKDVARIVTDKTFRRSLDAHDPSAASDMLMPWLMRAATQRVSEPGRSPKMDRVWTALRQRTGLQALAFSTNNALQQLTGVFLSAVKIENKRLLTKAMWNYGRSPEKSRAFVREKSEFMRTFLTSQAMEIQRQIEDILLNPSTYAKGAQYLQTHSQVLAETTQNWVNHVTWLAAYEDAAIQGLEGIDQVRHADSVVRETQGSFFPEDISRVEANSPFIRLLTMFGSYFNMAGNLQITEQGNALRSDRGAWAVTGRMAAVGTLGLMLPAILSQAIQNAIGTGDWLDQDDDDALYDDLLRLFIGAPLKMTAAMLPIAGQFGSAMYGAVFTDSRFDDDIRVSPTAGMITNAIKDAAYGRWSRLPEDAGNMIGLVANLPLGPLGRRLSYLLDVAQGDIQPENLLDLVRGVISGRAARK